VRPRLALGFVIVLRGQRSLQQHGAASLARETPSLP